MVQRATANENKIQNCIWGQRIASASEIVHQLGTILRIVHNETRETFQDTEPQSQGIVITCKTTLGYLTILTGGRLQSQGSVKCMLPTGLGGRQDIADIEMMHEGLYGRQTTLPVMGQTCHPPTLSRDNVF